MMENDALFWELYSQMEPKLKVLCVVKTPSASKFKQLSGGTGADSLL